MKLETNTLHRLYRNHAWQTAYLMAVAVLIVVGVTAVTGLNGNALAAGTATLSASPSSGSYTVGSSFTVSIYENSGVTPVNAVQADLTYDSTKLSATVVAGSAAGSPFTTVMQQTAGGGSVQIGEAILGSSMTGNQLLAKVTFKALADGTAKVTFAGTSQIDETSDSADVWNHSTATSIYTLAAPVTTAPPTSGSTTTTPSQSMPSKSSTTTLPKTTTTAPTAPTTATPTAPTPTPVDAASATGVKVDILVTDAHHKPISGATVTLGGQTQKTDSTGVAVFSGVSPSSYKVTVSANGYHAATTSVNVSSDAATQSVSMQKTASAVPLITIITAAVVVLGAASAGAVKLWQRRHFSVPRSLAGLSTGSVVVGGGEATNVGKTPVVPDAQPASTPQPVLRPDASANLVMRPDGTMGPSAPATPPTVSPAALAHAAPEVTTPNATPPTDASSTAIAVVEPPAAAEGGVQEPPTSPTPMA